MVKNILANAGDVIRSLRQEDPLSGKWQPVFLPGESQGMEPGGYCLWVAESQK